MQIREEKPGDIEAIAAVHRAAFAGLEYSAQTEHKIVAALRAAGDLYLSLVAEVDGRIVGHLAFAPVTIGGKPSRWVALGPIGILPAWQRRGAGKALIENGLDRLRLSAIDGVVLLGNPDYCHRFGFFQDPSLILPGVPPEFFMALPFGTSGEPRGIVGYPAGYSAE